MKEDKMSSKCIKNGCRRTAEPNSNFCTKHGLAGKGVVYRKEEPKTKEEDRDI